MQSLAIIFVLLSALIHVIWNLIAKKSFDKVIFIWLIILVGSVIYFPFFLYSITDLSDVVLLLIVFSGFFNAVAFYFLGKAYQNGNLSLTYPIARSSSIFVPFLAYFFIAEKLSYLGVLGIIIILFGIYILHLPFFEWIEIKRNLRNMKSSATIFALLTAFFCSFYMVIDKVGMTYSVSPFVFVYLREIISLVFLVPIVLRPSKINGILREWRYHKYSIIVVGFLMLLSYLLILYALKWDKVSYVISLRQISVVFGVLLSFWILKEEWSFPRVVASLIMFVGFLLVSLS